MRIPGNLKLLIVINIGLVISLQSCKRDKLIIPRSNSNNKGGANSGAIVSTYAGSTKGYVDGPVSSAKFIIANYLCMGPDGNLYVADSNLVRKIDRKGNVSTLANLSAIPAVPAISKITSMTIASSGLIYLAFDYRLGSITPTGDVSTNLPGFSADIPGPISVGPDGAFYVVSSKPLQLLIDKYKVPENQKLEHIQWYFRESVIALIVDCHNNVYLISHSVSGSKVYKMANNIIYNPGTTVTTVMTEQMAQDTIAVPDRAQAASFRITQFAYDYLAVAADGTIYVANPLKIWKITSDGTISTLAGSDAGYVDGPVAQAKFQQINAIELAENDKVLYVSDNSRIRKIGLK